MARRGPLASSDPPPLPAFGERGETGPVTDAEVARYIEWETEFAAPGPVQAMAPPDEVGEPLLPVGARRGPKRTISVRVDAEALQRAKVRAEFEDVGISNVLELALMRYADGAPLDPAVVHAGLEVYGIRPAPPSLRHQRFHEA